VIGEARHDEEGSAMATFDDDAQGPCEMCGEEECICRYSPWSGRLTGCHPAYRDYVRRQAARDRPEEGNKR
jgi:hypothetical protein